MSVDQDPLYLASGEALQSFPSHGANYNTAGAGCKEALAKTVTLKQKAGIGMEISLVRGEKNVQNQLGKFVLVFASCMRMKILFAVQGALT